MGGKSQGTAPPGGRNSFYHEPFAIVSCKLQATVVIGCKSQVAGREPVLKSNILIMG